MCYYISVIDWENSLYKIRFPRPQIKLKKEPSMWSLCIDPRKVLDHGNENRVRCSRVNLSLKYSIHEEADIRPWWDSKWNLIDILLPCVTGRGSEREKETERLGGGGIPDGSYSLIFLCKSGLIQKTFSVHKSVITFQKSPN